MGMSGLGAPGTRVTRVLGLDDEVMAYILQAVVFAVSINAILTCILLTYVIIGWWALAPFMSLVGLLIGLVVIVLGRARGAVAIVAGNLWAIGLFIGLYYGRQWYDVLHEGVGLIMAQLSVLVEFPWYVYAVLGVGLLLVAVKVSWKAAGGLLAVLAVVSVAWFSDGGAWLSAWQHLKWLLVPYSWPIIGACILLALVMAKEILFPSLEWTLNPLSLEELREVGLFGLWVPGVRGPFREEAPPPEEEGDGPWVNVDLTAQPDGRSRPQTQRIPKLPFGTEARAFYKAIYRGQTFALRTALKCGVTRTSFEKLRAAFEERGLAQLRDPRFPQQGWELTQPGQLLVEHLVSMGSTPTPPPPQ